MDRSFSRCLLVALGLHAGVALGARALGAPTPQAGHAAPGGYELEVAVLPEPTRAGSPGAEPGLPRGAASRAGPAAPARQPPRAGPAPDGAGSGASQLAASAAPSAEPGPEAPAEPERPVDLGLGGLWARRGLPDAPKPGWRSGAQAAGGLAQGLEARDRERGLGRGGVVATLARSAAISLGPSEGEASFSVETDGEGRVTSVSLDEGRGGAWGAVTAELRRALATRRLRVPPGANGLAVRVLVQAKVRLPSGARPGHAISGTGAGAEFDVADIAARPTRVVSARVTGERLL